MSSTRIRSLLLAAFVLAASASCNSALAPTDVSAPEVPVTAGLAAGALDSAVPIAGVVPVQVRP